MALHSVNLDLAKMPVFSSLPEESREEVRAAFRRLQMDANGRWLKQAAGSYEAIVELLSAPHAERIKKEKI